MINKNFHHGDKCPKCDYGMMIQKVSKFYQPFLACDSFPDCRFSCNLTDEDYKKYLKEQDKP